MTHNQGTNECSARARTTKVRAHEQAQYATPPYLPTPPTGPTEEHNPQSRPARTPGFADAREEPGNRDRETIPDETSNWLVGYRIDRINRTVMLLRLSPPLTEVFRGKPWASLIRGEGWVIPARYLAHAERLLAGADVDLFDIDGAPTPGQAERERRDDRSQTRVVLDEIQAARDEHERDTAAVNRAAHEAKHAFADAVTAARAKRGELDDQLAEASS